MRKAITCRRSVTVWARNSISSKMAGSGQNVIVVPVRPRGAFPVTSSLPTGFAAVLELEDVVVAVAVDLQEQPGGQGVDHRDPHAVEPARDLVAAPLTEFRPGMEHGEDHLGRRLALLFLHRAGGDTPAVVGHPDTAVGQQRDVDLGAVAGHGLVHRVVDDLPDQVVQTGRSGRSDVHPGSLPDRVQPSRTVMSSALYVDSSPLPSTSVFSATGAPFPTSID